MTHMRRSRPLAYQAVFVGMRGEMRLSDSTMMALVVLIAWFALNFIGVADLVEAEPPIGLAGVMLSILILVLAGGILRVDYIPPFYALSLLAWGFLQIETHWSTYVLAASENKLQWYERAFGRFWHVLPPSPGYTVPDAYHTILAALIVFNLALALSDTAKRAD
jgi:hypothetical protein